jgi:uncharacterized protein (TIGR00369 family)
MSAVGAPATLSERRREITWEDPRAMAFAGMRMPGLDYLRAIMDGTMPPPPIARLLDFEIVEVEAGRALFSMQPAEWMYNPIGSVHGGVAATILDTCMGCAVQSTLPAGVGYATSDLQVRYLRPMESSTGRVLAEGRLVHGGRRVATAEGRLFIAGEETLLAHATTGCLILRPPAEMAAAAVG